MVSDKKTLLAEAATSAKRNRQKNDMGGVGAQYVKWDEVFFEKVFAEA